ncbi:protease Do-like 7 isoform X2 [Rhododendron vialii]|uniref:protease Do-like 7 isoform X2 n=1 Tax=Rhododendron vialii TaxID=182163 RepID=UPI00265E400A|nr:protease Do-like 7 isoform X2 [Rhododendron vialii]
MCPLPILLAFPDFPHMPLCIYTHNHTSIHHPNPSSKTLTRPPILPPLLQCNPFPLKSSSFSVRASKGDSRERSPSVNAMAEEKAWVEIGAEFKEGGGATAEDWRNALGKVVPAVVVIRTTTCRAFDTESAGSGYATGFVVDKKRGIILTNRHVVKTGPVVAEAMFLNREEIPVYPVYRDPVHDFGFFRYDPGSIQFLSYEEIPLAPEAASVGLEIRVVGNDSGEKVSILAGTLARLDRDAPYYKKNGYNDFNTFYIQAASGTKGGSSGSPVVDSLGRAVALNAGSKTSSSSAFFLPLERVVRALKLLRKGIDSCTDGWGAVYIPRGTLQVITQFLKMETLLDDSVDRKIELQIERGGTPFTVDLTVQDLHSITPDSFLEVSGAVIHPLSYQQARNFRFRCGLVYVAEPGYLLRAKVPRLSIIKKFGGEEISRLEDLVSVLSKLTRGARVPLEYISYKDRHRSKSVLVTIDRHEWYGPPLIYTRDDSTGLWTGKPALPPDSLLLSSSMISVEQGLENDRVPPDAGEASPIEHMCQNFNQESADGVTSMESSFEGVAELQNTRDNSDVGATKDQIEEDSSADSPTEEKMEDLTSSENALLGDYQGSAAVATNASVAERVIEPALVMLEVHIPPSCMHDGVHSQHSSGTGVIVYHSSDLGLVVVDKATVVISASDVMLSFAAFPIEIPGEVVFLHPVHNYALVAYDPSALGADGASVVRAAKLLPKPPLCRGDAVYLVGLSRSLQATSRKSVVTNAHAALNIGPADSPRYRATNMEVIELTADFGRTFSGVLTDEHGRVQALWASFSTELKYGSSTSVDHHLTRGIPIHTISHVLNKFISGANGPNLLINGIRRKMPLVRILEVELYPRLLSKARSFGLSDKWVQTLVKKDPIRRQVLRIKGCLAGSTAEDVLEQGDMILAINEEPITCFGDIEDACHALDQCDESDGKLQMTIFRQGHEIELLVGTDVRDGNGTTRVINWCGCIVQDPYPAVRALGFLPEEGHGVYVSRWSHGSPANRYGLYALQWIVEINGKPTPHLDAFVEVTKEIDDGEFIRVKTVHLTGKPRVLTLKQDLHYWPMWEVRRNPNTAMWQYERIKALDRGIP